ncbi:MAG: cadmium-translocating P-type ATPase [Clostridia bacterium]|nr:cadmium-translocating P-type ATPase [Clostridia bacterium]
MGIIFSVLKLEIISAIFFVAAGVSAGAMCVTRAINGIRSKNFFDENTLMTIAAIGAVAIGEYPECAAVMILYQVGELFQSLAVGKSRKAISELGKLCPDTAEVFRNNEFITVDATSVLIGETIRIKAGERIPVDCVIVNGSTTVDTSPVTGESLPIDSGIGTQLYSGCVNLTGLITATVTRPADESAAARILKLTEQASDRKTASEAFITRFAKVYTPLVCIIAATTAFVIPLIITAFGGNFLEHFAIWGKKSLSMLVISCPCALVISVPLGYFCGLGRASSSGILIKGSAFIDTLAKAEYAVFDKTGTLTKGKLAVSSIETTENITKEQLIKLAASAEIASSHPIAKAICNSYKGEFIPVASVNEIAGKGVEAELNGIGVVAVYKPEYETDTTTVEVSLDNKVIGAIQFRDELKDDSKEALKTIKTLGIKQTVILTGDGAKEAERVREALSVDVVFSRLLPENKLTKIEELCDKGTVVYVGDGINDSPSLARADAGVAIGALGTEAAIEAADVVLMDGSPMRLAEAIKLSRKTYGTVKFNIAISLAVKISVLTLSLLGITGMWSAVLADVGMCIICVSNSMRLLKK